MRIAIASDHAGFDQKTQLVPFLQGLGHEVVDMGPETGERVDYPDYAEKVAHAVAADKVAGVRAVNCVWPEFAELARRHNDANVITLSGRFVTLEENERILKVFLVAEFEGGRHAQRVAKIMALDASGKREAKAAPKVTPMRSTLAESLNAAVEAKLGPVEEPSQN